MKIKIEDTLVLNIPYKVHIYDEENNKNSNIILPNQECTLGMDINKSSENEKYIKSKLLNLNVIYLFSSLF